MYKIRSSMGFSNNSINMCMKFQAIVTVTVINCYSKVIWVIQRGYRSRGSSWALSVGTRKKWNDRTRKKSQNGYILPVCGEAPTEAMYEYMKICLVRDVRDLITCAKFQNEIFRGYDCTGGRIFHFPIDFRMGLTTVQRYCAACESAKTLI